MMNRFSLRYVTPTGQINEALPDVVELNLSPIFCKPGTVTFKYPANGVNFSLLHEESEIAIFFDGVEVGELRCIVETVAGDDASSEEDGAIWEFTARTNLALLDRAVVYPIFWPATEFPFHGFVEDSPGYVMKQLIQAAQTRGALSGITLDFTEFVDSNGNTWANEVTILFNAGVSYSEVFEKLVELEVMEGQMVGRTLKLYNPNTWGVDRTTGANPVLFTRGRDLKESPRTTSNRNLKTTLLVAGDNGMYTERQSSAPILTAYGRRESYFSQSGVGDTPTLQLIGDNKLQQVNRPKMEKTHGLVFGQGTPEPITNFTVGDWVLSDVGRGFEKLRVKQWVMTVSSDGVMEGSIVLNDLFQEIADFLNDRLDNLVGGNVIVGPSEPGTNDTSVPGTPVSVGLSSLSYFDNQGNALAQVTISWPAVTTNTDGTPVNDLSRYIIRWRYTTDTEYRAITWVPADQTTTYVSSLLPNSPIQVQVAAEDRSGHLSGWAVGSTTTAYDTNPPPKPSSPIVTAKLGSLFISWDGKDYLGATMPSDLFKVQVHVSSGGSGFVPSASTLKTTLLPGGGEAVVGGLVYGTQYWVKLIAQDKTGNLSVVSDNTVSTTAVFTQVVHTDLGGNVVDFTNITFKDIGNLMEDGSFELQVSADKYNPLPFVEVVSGVSGSPSPKVLRIDPYVAASSTNRYVATLISDMLVIPGQKYVGIASYMATTGWSNAVFFEATWKDGTGATISTSTMGPPVFPTVDNTWKTRQSLSGVTVPNGAVTADVKILQASNTASSGFFYYDQIEVRLMAGTVLIEDAAINNAKIANLAVNDAKISDLSVGKVTAGTISANWILGASIRTAASGARVELNSTGLHAFNSGNVEVVTISASTGNITAYGTFIAGAPSSNRIELNPTGGPGSTPAMTFKNPSLSWFQDPVMWVEPSNLGISMRSGQLTNSSQPYTRLILSNTYWTLGVQSSTSFATSSLDSNGSIVLTSGNTQDIQVRSGSLLGGSSEGGIGLFGKLMVNYNDSMMLSYELIFTAGAGGATGTLNWTWGPTLPAVPRHFGPGFWADGRIILGTYTALSTTGGSVAIYSLTGAGSATNCRCWIMALRTT